MKKVIVEFSDINWDGLTPEKECIDRVHKILLGIEPYPLMDPCRPYVGTIVQITCGHTTEPCSVWNEHNINYKK